MSSSLSYRTLRLLPALLIIWLGLAPYALADDTSKAKANERLTALEKATPESVEDLKLLQEQVKTTLKKVLPATVNVRMGNSQGSGVIVSKDGYVLTAGHVAGQPDKDATIVLQDGRRLKAKTLGVNRGIDSGMVKITEEGEWPFVEMGVAADLKPGQWCIATGHPGGFKPGRTPVVRLGRVLGISRTAVTTDCTLVGGDSGGPLFDLEGNVIGIHSRIGNSIAANIHVPVDTYRDTWDRLVKGEAWGGPSTVACGGSPNDPFLGVQGDLDGKDCKILDIVSGSPAEKAGLRTDDVVKKFDGQEIRRYEDLIAEVRKKKPGDEVTVEVLRGDRTVKLKATVGKRSNS